MVKGDFKSIKEAMKQGSGEVALRGWIYRERGSSKYRFIVLRDSSNIIQCVIARDVLGDEKFEEISKLQIEASVEVFGEIKEEKRAPSGYEVQVKDLNIIGKSDTFPISKDQSVEFLADNRHLWLRSRKMTSIMKIRSTVFGAIHEFFRSKGFYEYQSPIFQGMQCEGGSTLFECDYFGKPIYLAQTWQLYAEPAIFALEKIYTIAPSFRAEKSKTSRHLTEYWHAEMEVAWENFDDLQDYGDALVKHVVGKVLAENSEELKLLGRDVVVLQATVEKSFPRITYTEALKVLKEKCGMDIEWGKDLRTVEENELSKLYDTPIIVTHYPKEVKAFYMKEAEDDPKVVLGYDLIGPEEYGELIGASEREVSIKRIKERLVAQGENVDDYTFYLDTRRWGSVPHCGFGLGVERLISWICKLDNIKDSIPFPRTMTRWQP